MQADESGLQALEAKIDADTTVAAALSDYEQIFSGYRVYRLVLPVVNDVVRVDYLDNLAAPQVNEEVSELKAQVNSANQAVINPLIAGMQAQLQVISSATTGLSGQLLSYTAAQWDSNQQLLVGANANIATADKALTTARSFYNRALAYLRHGLSKDKSPKRAPHHTVHLKKAPRDRDGRGRR